MERLPQPFATALSAMRPAPTALGSQQDASPDAVIIVVVNDAAGLGALTARVQSGCGNRVMAVYTGERPNIAVRCAQSGAAEVICLNDTPLDALIQRITAFQPKIPEQPVLDALPLGVAIRNPDGTYPYRNPAHRAIDLSRFHTDPDGHLDTLDLEQITDKSSGQVLLRSRTPLPDNPAGQVLDVLEDITGRHTDQDEILRQRDMLARRAWDLAQANRELSGLDRAKADFIALASHEIRTPLTALRTSLHLLGRMEPEHERAQRCIDMANRNVGRLAALADDLLEFTKLETAQNALTIAEASATACLWEAVDQVRTEADALGVIIECEISTPLPDLSGEAARIGQALRRLLEHGVRRSAQGGKVQLHAACLRDWTVPSQAVSAHPPRLPMAPDGWMELCVTDRGGTLPLEQVAHLFTGFGSSRDPLANPVEGGGLGLAICQSIVSNHGGLVWAEPVTPDGLKLVLRLPCLSVAGLGLLHLSRHHQQMCRKLRTPWVVSICTAASNGPSERLASACRNVDWGGAEWVALDSPEEIIALISDGEEQIDQISDHLSTLLASSNGDDQPIQIGWASPRDGEDFDEALCRARASTRPLSVLTD